MANETAFNPEYIFIAYDGIIKNYRLALIEKILKTYKDAYKDFIDVDSLEKMSYQQLMGLVIRSTESNIIEYLAKKKFDTDTALIDVYNKYPELYEDSSLLSIGSSIHILLRQKFTSKIYIWTPNYDERIYNDIQMLYGANDVIEYITGSFTEVINSIEENITSYILNDIELVKELIAIGKVSYSNILLANYGYNYRLNDKGEAELDIDNIDELAKYHIFKIVTFEPTNDYSIE